MNRCPLLTLLLAACSTPAPLFVPSDGAGTILLLVMGAPADARAFVIDAQRGDVQSLSLEAGGDLDLYAFYYAAPPDAFGLATGSIGLLRDGTGQPIPVERGRKLRTAAVVGGTQSAWTELEDTPASIAGFTLDIAALCARLMVESVPLATETTSDSFRLIFAEADDSIVVGSYSGRFSRTTPRGSTLITVASTIAVVAGGLRTDDGTVWLIGSDGRLASGDLERGIRTPHARLETDPSALILLDGISGAAGTEIYAWTQHGVLAKFDGLAWTRLATATVADPRAGELALRRVGPDEAVAGRSTPALLLHYRHGVVRPVSAGGSSENYLGPRAFADVPELGVVGAVAELVGPALIEVPHFLRLDQGSWSELSGAPSTVHHPRAMLATGRASFFFGGFRGILLQYRDGRWSCPEIFFSGEFTSLVPIAHGYAAVYDSFNRHTPAVVHFGFFP